MPTAAHIARRLTVHGTVQGVGFRPFVFQLATSQGLNGTVSNTGEGLTIHVEGPGKVIDTFCRLLKDAPPPLAHVTGLSSESHALEGFTGFTIDASIRHRKKSTFISPDVGVCPDCLSELRDPLDRRYRYPFINCTQCGPRYTIIEDLPYDRPLTVMKTFAMCDACRAEFEDPGNRRFHAQPIACPDCGPRVSLHDIRNRLIPGGDPILDAAALLKQGHIVAVKGLGGFHLAVDALNDDAVERLRSRKHRPDKPLAVMAPSLETVKRFAIAGPDEKKALASATQPIVLLEKKSPCPLSEGVAPRNRHVGVMLPYTPLHYLLAEGTTALVMTSGNMGGSPVETDNTHAFESLSRVADYFLVHNRNIIQRCDDSLVHPVGKSLRLVRRSRGYAPAPITLKQPMPRVLAVGGELKNTVCLTRDRHAFLSQHIGDMVDADTYRFFEETVDHMKHVLGISPERIAHDMHPDFETTRYALNISRAEKVAVQHHHAHVVSCMAEHHLTGPVIGLALDGNGYGSDGAVWGGEVLVAEPGRFQRAAHLGYVPMPGGDAAVREPWRMALSYLYQAFGNTLHNLDLPMLQALDNEALRITVAMASKEVNAPLTSSCGRLFDAVAAIIGLRHKATFEGQAAMELEAIAGKAALLDGDRYRYDIFLNSAGTREVDLKPLIRMVASDAISGIPAPEISRRFHGAIISLFTDLCIAVRKETGIRAVVLSGGVFQNALILTGISRALEREGFDVYSHSRVPTNDGGLSLGQAVVAGSLDAP